MTTSSFFQEPEIVTIRDEAISISPLPVKHLAKAAKAAAPLLTAFTEGKVDAMLVLSNVDTIITLIAIATVKDEEWVGNLNPAELLELLTAVIKINMDFFSAAIMPQVKLLLKSVETVAKTT